MYLKPDVFPSLLFCGGSSSSSTRTRKLLFISSHSPMNSLTIIQYKPSQAKPSRNDSGSRVRSKEPRIELGVLPVDILQPQRTAAPDVTSNFTTHEKSNNGINDVDCLLSKR